MRRDSLNLIIVCALIAICGVFFVRACETNAQEATATRTEIEDQIREIEEEIDQLDDELGTVQVQTRTLQGAVNGLNAEIKRSELTIRGLNLSIQKTEGEVVDREVKIDATENRIEKQRSSLAEYLRTVHKKSGQSLIETMLAQDLSDAFHEISVLEGLQQDAQNTLAGLLSLKTELEADRAALQEVFVGWLKLNNRICLFKSKRKTRF
jgi:peptidoglycan hydrolase CwlO-like protein